MKTWREGAHQDSNSGIVLPSNSKHIIMPFIIKALALGIHITSSIPAERLSQFSAITLVWNIFWMFSSLATCRLHTLLYLISALMFL